MIAKVAKTKRKIRKRTKRNLKSKRKNQNLILPAPARHPVPPQAVRVRTALRMKRMSDSS
jgi:hypothetical protein